MTEALVRHAAVATAPSTLERSRRNTQRSRPRPGVAMDERAARRRHLESGLEPRAMGRRAHRPVETHDLSLPCLVSHDGHVLAYTEVYWATRHPLGSLYPAKPHDIGIHIAFGDINTTGRGLCTQLLRGLADGLLAADPDCTRIVGEPDVNDKAIIRAGIRAGFRQHGEVRLPHKTAALMMFPPE